MPLTCCFDIVWLFVIDAVNGFVFLHLIILSRSSLCWHQHCPWIMLDGSLLPWQGFVLPSDLTVLAVRWSQILLAGCQHCLCCWSFLFIIVVVWLFSVDISIGVLSVLPLFLAIVCKTNCSWASHHCCFSAGCLIIPASMSTALSARF